MQNKLYQRVGYIDIIKCFMTFCVFICHFSIIFCSQYFYPSDYSSNLSNFVINSPLNIINNGVFAVNFFFFATAFLVTRKVYFSTSEIKKSFLVEEIIKLLKLVFIGVFFGFCLLFFGAIRIQELVTFSDKYVFVKNYYNFTPSLKSVLLDIWIYKSSVYNPPLWTMKYTLFGIDAFRCYGLFALMIVITNSEKMLSWLERRKILRFLGKISGYFYIFHWLILCSLGCFIFLTLTERTKFDTINKYVVYLLVFCSCLVATIFVSYITWLCKRKIYNLKNK